MYDDATGPVYVAEVIGVAAGHLVAVAVLVQPRVGDGSRAGGGGGTLFGDDPRGAWNNT